MKLDYNAMQPGQEFWATFYDGAIFCEFVMQSKYTPFIILAKENGKEKQFSFFPELGCFIPYDNELEALKNRKRIIRKNTKAEVEKIKLRIKMLEAENDLHQ